MKVVRVVDTRLFPSRRQRTMQSSVRVMSRVHWPRKVVVLLSMGMLLLTACGGGGGATSSGGGLNGGGGGSSAGQIKLGALATLTGPFAALGKDGMRGVDLAVAEFNGTVAGKKITVVKESSDATPNVVR